MAAESAMRQVGVQAGCLPLRGGVLSVDGTERAEVLGGEKRRRPFFVDAVKLHPSCATWGGGGGGSERLSLTAANAPSLSRIGVRRLGGGARVAAMAMPPVSAPRQLSEGEVRRKLLDDQLSKRWLALDPAGYFIIYLDRSSEEIVADHYCNIINDKGIACDPKTGKPIPCDGSYKPTPNRSFRGKTAKELSVAILETNTEGLQTGEDATVSLLTHANYLGREFQKAEAALASGEEYIQD